MRAVRWFVVCAFGLTSVLVAPAQNKPMQVTATSITPAQNKGVPLVFYTGEGRFEIIAMAPADAQEALIVANSVWRALSRPLGLPGDGFSSPVAVRMVPEKDWKETAVFSVTAEPGGRVNVRICRREKPDDRVMRRALVQAVLFRQAVAWYGLSPKLAVPLWLEQACVALSQMRDRPAMFDAMQQESERIAPPSLETLLAWKRGEPEPRSMQLASFWLFLHLQAEAEGTSRWARWLQANLGGADLMAALTSIYGGAWQDRASGELWWQVGFYNESTSSDLPLMSMEATRNWLADRCRWLAFEDGRERLLSFDDLWADRKTLWIKTGMIRRGHELQNQLPRLHPFYRNGAISLGRLYEAGVKGDAAAFKAAQQALAQDARDGRELENDTEAALDALEAKR